MRLPGEEWRLALALVTVGAFGPVAIRHATVVGVRADDAAGGNAGLAVAIGLPGGLVGAGCTLGALLLASRPG